MIVDYAAYAGLRPSVVAIGVFDGVHRGHQRVIGRAVELARARGSLALVITFDPAPRAVLAPDSGYTYLTSLADRLDLIARIGVDAIALIHFTRDVASLTADAFVADLTDRFHATDLVVGPDFALGRGREGSIEVLTQIGAARGLDVHVVEPLAGNGQRVSSTHIRQLIREGDVGDAARLLGHAPRLRGVVVQGAGRGRQIGVPTANLEVPADACVPANGVYAARAHVPDRGTFAAAVNVGIRPSFDNGARTVEAHLIDFDGDLYGRELRLDVLARLRGEQRFASIGDLVTQIRDDVAAARRIVAAKSERELGDAPGGTT